MPRPEPGAAHSAEADLPVGAALRRHWPEYAIEGGFLFVFVLAAGVVSAWLQATGAGAPALHRLMSGLVIGGLLMAMIYSPWGRRSGAHMNPAITLAYLRLGKVGRWDGLFYILAQVALGFHLYHGLWSLFQSLGWSHPRFNHWRSGFAHAFAWIITIGNISFPLAVLTGLIR